MSCDGVHDAVRKQMLTCVRCGKCRVVCPTLDAESPGTPLWEIFDARGRIKLALGLDQAHIPINELFVKSEYSCFFCNACVEDCPSQTKVTDIIALTRKWIFNEGKSPPAEIMMNKAVIESGNIFNLNPEDRMLWAFDIEDIIESKINVHAKILYFIGCQASYKGSLAKIPLGFVELLEHLKVDYTLLGEEERCCGSPLFLIGDTEEFAKEAREKIARIKNLGVQLVLTTCPSCYNSFKRYEKVLGEALPFKLQFATDFLDEKLITGELKITRAFSKDLGIVTYHDACELGRYQGIYDSPRHLLKAIPKIQYKEMPITREKTHCCGGGGLVAVGYPEIKNAQSARKILEFQENGVNTVVTACVGCYDTLSQAANTYNKQHHNKSIHIMDLIDLISNLVDR
ncbi:MAG: (Fe-S)-binding protein [Candidatus Thorarchaeota archaeon]